jgi:glycosyltransferase involved in cell wall biosynthesis
MERETGGEQVRRAEGILLSIIVPVFNEQECLPVLIERLKAVRASIGAEGEVELVVVNAT